jgi:hypothetical protein
MLGRKFMSGGPGVRSSNLPYHSLFDGQTCFRRDAYSAANSLVHFGPGLTDAGTNL